MFYDATKESCTVWVAELASNTVGSRGDQPGGVTKQQGVTTDRSDYEPVDKVPFPNSSRMISERSVQFLKANETWLRSIIKADCS